MPVVEEGGAVGAGEEDEVFAGKGSGGVIGTWFWYWAGLFEGDKLVAIEVEELIHML